MRSTKIILVKSRVESGWAVTSTLPSAPPSPTAQCWSEPCISSLTALNGALWVFKGPNGQLIKHNVSSSFKVNSGNMAKSAALAGLGFAILPEEYCLHELEEGALQSVALEAEPEDLVFYAFYAGRKHLAKKVSAFIEYLQSSLVDRD